MTRHLPANLSRAANGIKPGDGFRTVAKIEPVETFAEFAARMEDDIYAESREMLLSASSDEETMTACDFLAASPHWQDIRAVSDARNVLWVYGIAASAKDGMAVQHVPVFDANPRQTTAAQRVAHLKGLPSPDEWAWLDDDNRAPWLGWLALFAVAFWLLLGASFLGVQAAKLAGWWP